MKAIKDRREAWGDRGHDIAIVNKSIMYLGKTVGKIAGTTTGLAKGVSPREFVSRRQPARRQDRHGSALTVTREPGQLLVVPQLVDMANHAVPHGVEATCEPQVDLADAVGANGKLQIRPPA